MNIVVDFYKTISGKHYDQVTIENAMIPVHDTGAIISRIRNDYPEYSTFHFTFLAKDGESINKRLVIFE